MYHFLSSLIKYFVSLIEVLLGARLVLRFLGASERAIVVDWLYQTTDTIILPFRFIFPNVYSKWGIFDIVVVSAMLGYFILALVILKSIDFIFRKQKEKTPQP